FAIGMTVDCAECDEPSRAQPKHAAVVELYFGRRAFRRPNLRALAQGKVGCGVGPFILLVRAPRHIAMYCAEPCEPDGARAVVLNVIVVIARVERLLSQSGGGNYGEQSKRKREREKRAQAQKFSLNHDHLLGKPTIST